MIESSPEHTVSNPTVDSEGPTAPELLRDKLFAEGDAPVPDAPPTASMPAVPAPLPKLAIPGYRILKPVGRGGMALVHLAERLGTAGVPVRCVVKMIRDDRQSEPTYRERLLDEARIVAELRHPNLVPVLDVGVVDQRLYLAMEWVDGVDLSELLELLRKQRRELPLRHLLYILKEVLQGLHHAHTAEGPDGPLEVVHRDVSPGNVLISRQGAVKLTDFGVAQGAVAQRIERKGLLSGKVQYFSPELFETRVASRRSDLFALGVTFWEMLTVRPLFSRKLTPLEMRDVMRAFDPRTLLDDDLTLPDGLEPVLLRALAADPEERYASAVEFLEDVNDYVYESGLRMLSTDFEKWLEGALAPDSRGGRRRLVPAKGGG